MTDRLRELLDPKPTSKEDANENYPHSAEGDALRRLALVRSTMLECAKAACEGCARGLPLDEKVINWHTDKQSGFGWYCTASAIHALLALSQSTEKGTDNE